MDNKLNELLECSPIIATVLDWESVEMAVKSECEVVLVAFGNLLELDKIVEKLRYADKKVIVHLELIDGFSSREIAIDILLMRCQVDGIISTKAAHIRRARQREICSILRMFMIDTKSYMGVPAQLQCKPDFVEIEPGIMPKVIADLKSVTEIPIIASGFITEKAEIISALSAGAMAVSTSQIRLWDL